MITQIRTRPAGLAGIAAGWAFTELEHGLAGAIKLLRLIEDPFVQVQVNAATDGEDWQVGPSIEEARGKVAALTPAATLDVSMVAAEIAAAIRQIAEVQIHSIATRRLELPSLDVLQKAIDHYANLPLLPADEEQDEDDVKGLTLADLFNTNLPAAEPTLERGPEDTRAPQSVGAEGAAVAQPQAPDPAQNAVGTAADPSNPAPDAPDAKTDGKSKDKPKA